MLLHLDTYQVCSMRDASVNDLRRTAARLQGGVGGGG